jgi:hypothetical protein
VIAEPPEALAAQAPNHSSGGITISQMPIFRSCCEQTWTSVSKHDPKSKVKQNSALLDHFTNKESSLGTLGTLQSRSGSTTSLWKKSVRAQGGSVTQEKPAI